MKGMCMSVNISHWITVGLQQLLPTWTIEQINSVSQGLTEHKTKSKTSHYKAERNFTATHHWLWKLKNACPCPSVVELDLMFQGITFSSGTLTHTSPLHTFAIQCLWLTQPLERKTSQRATLSEPQCTVPQPRQSSVPAKQLHPSETWWMFSTGPALYA